MVRPKVFTLGRASGARRPEFLRKRYHGGLAYLIVQDVFLQPEPRSQRLMDTGRRVNNSLVSDFVFYDDLIVRQKDDCDARSWSMQALGPWKGLVAWAVPWLLRRTAGKKLDAFIEQHPEYR